MNPRSAGGATQRAFTEVEPVARGMFDEISVLRTEHPGHASHLAESAAGHDLVVAVGGDGTANEVVNGLARLPAGDRPVLGVVPAGTGCDLVRSLDMPRDLADALAVLRDGDVRQCDWMRIETDTGVRFGINVAGFGMEGEIVARANESSKRFGGRATFAFATLRTALSYRPPQVEIEWKGESEGRWTGPLASVFMANGHYCGGGMWVGAGGSMHDGLVEMTLLPEMPLLRSAWNARRLYSGTMGEVEGVVTARISSLTARCDRARVLVDIDGEQPGALPLTMNVESEAIRIVGRWNA